MSVLYKKKCPPQDTIVLLFLFLRKLYRHNKGLLLNTDPKESHEQENMNKGAHRSTDRHSEK